MKDTHTNTNTHSVASPQATPLHMVRAFSGLQAMHLEPLMDPHEGSSVEESESDCSDTTNTDSFSMNVSYACLC